MKHLLFALIWTVFLIAKASSLEVSPESSAPAVALNAFHNATEVAVEGSGSTDIAKPLLPIRFTIKNRKTISDIRKLLESAHFRAVDDICPDKWATGSLPILYLVVTKNDGEKVTIYLIQGELLRITKLHDGISDDPNFIFPLGKLLLHSQETVRSHRR